MTPVTTTTIERTARGPMRIDQTDYRALDTAEHLRRLEVEGYTVLPDLVDPATIARLREELADLPMGSAPYAENQRFALRPPQWHSPTFLSLVGHPPVVQFLEQALGKDPVFMLGHYVTSGPGVPGLTLHSDYQPYGSEAKGFEESSPATVRLLVYLDDLTPGRAPFTILPRSHLSLHRDANPYLRYDDHPEMVTVCLNAGDGVLFNVRAFHGTHPMLEDFTRGMIELAYRPAWARSAGEVAEWPAEEVAKAPDHVKPLLRGRNVGTDTVTPPVITDGVATVMPPSRWDS